MSPWDQRPDAAQDWDPSHATRPSEEFAGILGSAATVSGQGSSTGVNDEGSRSSAPQTRELRLVAAALRGDDSAVDTLVTRMVCIPRIIHALDRVRGGALGSAGREDAAQESRLRIWRDLGSYNGLSSLETWMYRYCLNVYRELHRRSGGATGGRATGPPTSGPAVDPDRLAQPGPDASEKLQLAQERLQIRELVDALPDPEQEVVTLKHADGLSFAEMEERTGISSNTLKGRYYRACRTLRGSLSAIDRPNGAPPID